jgi:hypothetical protein
VVGPLVEPAAHLGHGFTNKVAAAGHSLDCGDQDLDGIALVDKTLQIGRLGAVEPVFGPNRSHPDQTQTGRELTELRNDLARVRFAQMKVNECDIGLVQTLCSCEDFSRGGERADSRHVEVLGQRSDKTLLHQFWSSMTTR